ncbi:MAG TPA: helix-turn-helix domain-containing protein [Paraburkholderia sp.]|uniref:GlxA family transcriptional regulator n=1 Tax=Paraburkholderia sp. TaxID=1926495 RepID=UPI002D117DBA|nr:helix-turn-helix domain-containing protein [Paraburkholderia sp.]HTR10143.1 helix-turn-helix domain-containing protein [Paraburkholderia sp.]
MRVLVFSLDGVFDTGMAVVLDVLRMANGLSALARPGEPPAFEVELVGLQSRIRTALGMSVAAKKARTAPLPDWVVMPAISAATPATLVECLERPAVREAGAVLRGWQGEGVHIAAACIGTFLLAESGLLAGEEATTTWWLSPLFRSRYPEVRLDQDRMLVPSGPFVTAGAAMGHLDLALWLVRQASPELATLVARYMLVDGRVSQAPYIIPDHLAHSDPLIERFERWTRANLARGFSLQEAARELATSPRTLQRRAEAVLGKSPLSYFQDRRVERARHLIETSSMDLDAIAAQVGYADGATLRTLLRRRLGRGVRELRAG